MLLVVLLTQAPRRSTSHAYARDLDQAGLLLDALRALAERSGLASLLVIGAETVTVKGSGAVLRIESADAASAFGRVPFFVVADELAQWPTTRGARTLWAATISGLVKRRDSRFVAISSAGDPAHWSARIIEDARRSEPWRVSEVTGALPWVSEDDLAEQRDMLPASAYARLHLNIWAASEDRLVSVEDLRACVTLNGPLERDPNNRYVTGLDLGLKNDRTVLTVCHAERQDVGGPRIVLDRLAVLQGTRDKPVQLADVERLALDASKAYGHATIRLDPWQAVGLAQRLRDQGVSVEEWAFTSQSVGRLGQTLHLLLRDHRLALPDDAELLDELMTVRLRESAPGVYRLDHDSGQHDDRAVSLGLAALALTERSDSDRASVSIPSQVVARMGITSIRQRGPLRASPYAAARLTGDGAAIAAAQRAQSPGARLYGLRLPVPGSINDPERLRVHRSRARQGRKSLERSIVVAMTEYLPPIREADFDAVLASIDAMLAEQEELNDRIEHANEAALRELRLDTYNAWSEGRPPSPSAIRQLYWNYPMIHVAAIAKAANMSEEDLRKVAGAGRFELPCRGGCGRTVVRLVKSRSEMKASGRLAYLGRDPRSCEECNARVAQQFEARRAEHSRHYEAEWEETKRALHELRAAGIQPSRRYVEYPGIGGTFADPDFTPPN